MYWRRRAVALIALVVAIALVSWIAVRLFGGGSTAGSASGATTSAGQSSADGAGTQASGSSAEGSAAATGSSDGSGASDASSTAASSSAAATSAAPSETPATSSAPAPPAVPQPCQDAQLQIIASATNNVFTVGDKPKLTLSVINAGQTACERDLNAATQEILIFDANGVRMWSSNDCYPESTTDVRLLQPGQRVDFSLTWSGKVSEPTCTAPRPLLGAGDYWLEARQGGAVSGRTPFHLVK